MGKPTGFKEFTRELPSKLAVKERKKNYKEFVTLLPRQNGTYAYICSVDVWFDGLPIKCA